MRLLRNAGESRAPSRPDASAPPPRAAFLRWVFDHLLGAMPDVEVEPDLLEQEVDWPGWAYLEIRGVVLDDGRIVLSAEDALDLDRFDAAGWPKPRPTIEVDRGDPDALVVPLLGVLNARDEEGGDN
jgi:hypothetical protein